MFQLIARSKVTSKFIVLKPFYHFISLLIGRFDIFKANICIHETESFRYPNPSLFLQCHDISTKGAGTEYSRICCQICCSRSIDTIVFIHMKFCFKETTDLKEEKQIQYSYSYRYGIKRMSNVHNKFKRTYLNVKPCLNSIHHGIENI